MAFAGFFSRPPAAGKRGHARPYCHIFCLFIPTELSRELSWAIRLQKDVVVISVVASLKVRPHT